MAVIYTIVCGFFAVLVTWAALWGRDHEACKYKKTKGRKIKG